MASAAGSSTSRTATEDVAEGADRRVFDLGHRNRAAGELLERGHALVGDAAGNDQVEVIQVVLTFSAKPWLVTHRAMRTPIAASFSSPTHAPVSPGNRAACDAERRRRPDQHLLEVANVAVDVAAIGLQVEDRIADELAGAVIRDVAAAAGLEDLDPFALPASLASRRCASGRCAS